MKIFFVEERRKYSSAILLLFINDSLLAILVKDSKEIQTSFL